LAIGIAKRILKPVMAAVKLKIGACIPQVPVAAPVVFTGP
jgi:hypothetical protein